MNFIVAVVFPGSRTSRGEIDNAAKKRKLHCPARGESHGKNLFDSRASSASHEIAACVFDLFLSLHLVIATLPPNDQTRWFAEFVQPHESMLRGWLRSRFGAQCDVDDLVQETYLRIAQARARGEVQAPKAFLFATARNVALDQLRRLRTANAKPLAESEAFHVFDDTANVAETVARNQELALLTEAIQTLPDRCRQIFTLRKVYGLSPGEIAEKLGVSENTVSAQLSIGLKRCAQFMLRRRDHDPSSR
jgi:RNA polymerase sigma factor (sigma-70 family)